MGQFDNKIVVVTGGTQGLGAATARLLAERGAQGLVICGRSEEKGRQQAAELEKLGTKTVYVAADLSKVEDCRAVIAAADKTFGRLDSLINVAGVTNRGYDTEYKPGTVRPALRSERESAVFPDAGRNRHIPAGSHCGDDRQHLLDVFNGRTALPRRL